MKKLSLIVIAACLMLAPTALAGPRPDPAPKHRFHRVHPDPAPKRLSPRWVSLNGCRVHAWDPATYGQAYNWHISRGGIDSCSNNHNLYVSVMMMQLLQDGWHWMYWTEGTQGGWGITDITNSQWVNLTPGRWYRTETCAQIDGAATCYDSSGIRG